MNIHIYTTENVIFKTNTENVDLVIIIISILMFLTHL